MHLSLTGRFGIIESNPSLQGMNRPQRSVIFERFDLKKLLFRKKVPQKLSLHGILVSLIPIYHEFA